jgi:hypothetical protein
MLLRQAVVEAKDRLLDASGRRSTGDRLRVGLDVLILAQPNGPEAPGRIEDLLGPAMQALADDRSLERPAPGSNLLNFLLFLDFDSYWAGSETNGRIRTGLQASIERWHTRQISGQPGFARIYLMDGQVKEQGRRAEALRIEELIILLCLMLFEGKRDDPGLRWLFEKQQDEIPPLATFGMRALERRQDLLALLSAAKFASGWLEYLMGNSAPPGEGLTTLRTQLSAWRPESLEFAGERQNLEQILERGLKEVEEQAHALSISSEGPGWKPEYSDLLDAQVNALKNRLSAWSGEYAFRASSLKLARLPERLNELVTAAIDNPRDPLPAGSVIDELLALRKSLDVTAPVAPTPADPAQWDGLAQAHGDFAWFRGGQLNPANLPRWWPLLAATLAAAWTPVVLDALNAVPPPDSNSAFLVRKSYELLMDFNQPAAVVLLLAVAAWAIGNRWFQPQIRKWLGRGFLGWSHPRQGVLTDRIATSIGLGAVADGIRAQADYVYGVALQRVNAEVRREIDRVVERLRARRSEMKWLRDEMQEFLRTHGIDPDASSVGIDSSARPPGGYRVSLDRDADLQKTLALNPPNRDRFRAAQADRHPLRRWHDDYCDTFLYPVIFLEDLGKAYYDRKAEEASSHDDASAAKIAGIEDFLERSGQFSLAFDWSGASGAVHDVQSWCVLPPPWKRESRIASALHNHAFEEQRIVPGSADDRAYFLKVQWGVSTDRLTRNVESQPEAPGAAWS